MAKTQTVTISLEEYKELLLKEKPSNNDHELLERFFREIEKHLEYSDYKYGSEYLGDNMAVKDPYSVFKEIMLALKYVDFERYMKMWNHVQTRERKRKDMEAQIEQMNKAKEMRSNE